MSAFGVIPLDGRALRFDAVAASANKCLQGIPGFAFCIAPGEALAQTEGNSPSLSPEPCDQWRFTPPTHAILAFNRALDEFDDEGGLVGRGFRMPCDPSFEFARFYDRLRQRRYVIYPGGPRLHSLACNLGNFMQTPC